MEAYEWGLSPLILEELEILDIAMFVMASSKRKEFDIKQAITLNNQSIYSLINIFNSVGIPMTQKSQKLPPFDKIFPNLFDDENRENNTVNNKTVLQERIERYRNSNKLNEEKKDKV